MTALVDARPAGLDLLFRPGVTLTLALTWPSGSLSGRTFGATLGGVPLSLAVVDDTMVIEVSDTQTAAVGEASTWLLLESVDGTDEPVIVGTWAPSSAAAAVSHSAVSVTQGNVAVDVAALVNVGLASHVNADSGRNVHGVVTHDWGRDGWAPFAAATMTADGAQSFAQSVGGGRGTLTATQPTGGNLRVAYVREGTEWVDSEVTSLVWGPSNYGVGTLIAQQGHIHRVREVSPGVYEGIGVWTGVFASDYSVLNTRAVRWDGTTLFQSGGDDPTGVDASHINRQLALVSRDRFTAFGLWFNNYSVHPSHLYGLANGDIVTVDSTDSTFDETDVAVNSVDTALGGVQVIEPTTFSASALAVDRGLVRPSGASSQKRWTPYWLSTRVRGGNATSLVVEWKRWRPEEAEPDWGHSRVQRRTVTSTLDVPIPTEAGMCALWGAHFVNGSSGSWGETRFRKL